MTHLDLGPVANGYQALKGMLFTPSSPESLKRLIDWLEQEQRYPELLQEAKQWQSEPLELECDFNRMCIGPTKLLVPPYESVYRDVGRQLNTDRTMKVADFYQQLGLVIDTSFNEPADYIGNELEFLFCAEALRHQQQSEDPAAAEELEQLAQVFLEQHIGTWYQTFTEGICQHARLDFWRCYAQVLEDFLTSRLKNSGVETPTAKHH